MKPTPREQEAARRLGEAVLECLLAHEQGAMERGAARRRDEARRGEAPAPRGATPPVPGLLTTLEAAKYLAVSAGTVQNYSAPRGPIPRVKVGAAVRYRLADLEAFVAERAGKGAAGTADR